VTLQRPDDVPGAEFSDEPFAAEDTTRQVPGGDGATTITPYRDGPLLVRGDFRLLDTDGVEIDPGRTTVALCRCGRSGIKPFCDGTHKRAGFRAASGPARPRPAARIFRDDRPADDEAVPGG
jgi:CDGSH-type Zn-finger protein